MPPGTSAPAARGDELLALVVSSPTVVRIVDALPALGLPDCWLAGGAVAQTVWNVLAGRPPGSGIADYDVVYCDPSDTTEAAQDRAAARVRDALPGLPVDLVNEARVHLWYEDVLGVPCPAYLRVEDALRSFATVASALAVRRAATGYELLAPLGVADTLDRVVRPNTVRAPQHVYEARATRWQAEWPALTVLPWPSGRTPRLSGRGRRGG